MKRKVKKYADGDVVTSRGGATNMRTRSADEIAEDNKSPFGRYSTKSVKSEVQAERPTTSGVEDYASMGKRAGATSPFSGPKEYISESIKESETESPKGIASGFKSGESKFERNDNEVKTPVVKKKAVKKAAAKPDSQSFPTRDRDRADQSFPLRGSSGTSSSSALTRAGTEARTPDVMGTARTRAGTVIPGRQEPNKEDVDKAMTSLASRMRKQDQENSFSLSPSKSPNRSYKSGGKATNMASGGKVSSASSRGDGIAQRGKTRGKMC
jgi:hypothetical protein